MELHTFQRLMDIAFGDIPNVLIYLDDLLIVSQTEEEMIHTIEIIFNRIEQWQIKIGLKKCSFFMKELKYLGHIISEYGSRPDKDYISKIIQLKEPQGVEDIGRMAGMIEWLAKYIPRLAKLLEPLNGLRRTGIPWYWGDTEKEAFRRIKEAVSKAEIVRHPDITRPFYLICDASDYAIGSVLMQEYDGIYYPVEFYSKLLDQNQRHWHISEKELISVIWSIEKFDKYLHGDHFHVFTDHRNIVQLLNYANDNKARRSKLIRWVLRLQEYDFTAHYITGAHNIADYFSRDILYPNKKFKVIKDIGQKEEDNILIFHVNKSKIMQYKTKTTPEHVLHNLDRIIDEATRAYKQRKVHSSDKQELDEEEQISVDISDEDEVPYYQDQVDIATQNIDWTQIMDIDILRKEQQEDAVYGPIIQALTTDNNRDIKLLPAYAKRAYRKNKFMVHKGILRLRGKNKQIVIPPHLMQQTIEYFHENQLAIHQDASRTIKIMQRYVYWFGMTEDVKRYVRYCVICKAAKTPADKKQGYLKLFTAKAPFSMVGIDIVGPLPVTKRGNRYILTTIDRFSRYIHLIPLESITAENVAVEFRAQYLLVYGFPEQILSDRGSQFTSSIFRILMKLFGIQKLFTSPYHPQSNGMIERSHRFIKERLRVIAAQNNLDFIKFHDWDNYIAEIQCAYNNTPNKITGIAPYNIVYGHTLRMPFDNIMNKDIDKIVQDTVNKIDDNTNTLKLTEPVRKYVTDLKQQQRVLIEEIKTNMRKYDKIRKRYYDKSRRDPQQYKPGEYVLIDQTDRVTGNKRKLNINKIQARVIKKINDNCYKIKTDTGKIKCVNITQIVKLNTDNTSDIDNNNNHNNTQ